MDKYFNIWKKDNVKGTSAFYIVFNFYLPLQRP